MSRGESWAFDKYRSANCIYVSGKKVINDILLLDQGRVMLQSRMAGYACYCTLFVYGTVLQPLLEHFQTLTRQSTQYKLRTAPQDIIWSYSELETPQKFGVVRCAGSQTEVVKDWLEKNLLPIRSIIGKDTYKAAFV
jgi:urease accessory protein